MKISNWKVWICMVLTWMISSCSAPDNPADGFEELTGLTWTDNLTVISYRFDGELGKFYEGIMKVEDTVWLNAVKEQLSTIENWNCKFTIFEGRDIKFYKEYFDLDTRSDDDLPKIKYCKKDFGNAIKGRILFCKDRLYFDYHEILDP